MIIWEQSSGPDVGRLGGNSPCFRVAVQSDTRADLVDAVAAGKSITEGARNQVVAVIIARDGSCGLGQDGRRGNVGCLSGLPSELGLLCHSSSFGGCGSFGDYLRGVERDKDFFIVIWVYRSRYEVANYEGGGLRCQRAYDVGLRCNLELEEK